MSDLQISKFESQISNILGGIAFLQINALKVTECSNVLFDIVDSL